MTGGDGIPLIRTRREKNDTITGKAEKNYIWIILTGNKRGMNGKEQDLC